MAGKVNAALVGLGVFLMVVAGGLTIRLVSTDDKPDPHIDAAPTSRTPTPSRAVGATTPPPSATPTTPTTTIRPSTTPPRTSAPPTATTPIQPPPPTWTLVWSDDFNTVDGSKWSPANNVTDNDACMLASNLSVASGVLVLRAERLDYDCDGQPRLYTSAHISTIGHASFTYGAFEVRATSPNADPTSAGLWPSFWLGSADSSGAIDVAAFNGGAGYANANQAVYCFVNQQSSYAVAGGTAGGFHTYRVEWEVGVLRWYVDGALVWTRDATTTPEFATYFAKPYYLNLNFPVGGAGGDPSGATLPAEFQVDYVRVYQR